MPTFGTMPDHRFTPIKTDQPDDVKSYEKPTKNPLAMFKQRRANLPEQDEAERAEGEDETEMSGFEEN